MRNLKLFLSKIFLMNSLSSMSCGWFTQGCVRYGRGAVHREHKMPCTDSASRLVLVPVHIPQKSDFSCLPVQNTNYVPVPKFLPLHIPGFTYTDAIIKLVKKISALVVSWFPHIVLHGTLLLFNSLCIVKVIDWILSYMR